MRVFSKISTASLSLGVELHLEVIRAPAIYIMNAKFLVENSSILTENFESTARNMPSIASNLKIWACSRARSILIKTMVEFTESNGEKIKSQKNEIF